MFKRRIWLGITLSFILLVFSINSFTAYYKYSQESGTNFYVGADDKADALEDTNEVRQILDDLGNLLGHSKRDDLYPENGTTGGYLGRLNYGLDTSKPAIPVVNDMYLATDTIKIYRCFVAENWVQVYPQPQIDFDFYNALADDHNYSGEVDSQPVGESVVFGDLLYFNWADKEWKKTDADAAATMPGLRIALESKTDGQTCLMLVKGYIRDDDAFNFGASMIYTSVTPGAMSSTAPTGTGDQVQRVGVAKSADILFFNPSIDVGEI